MTIILSTICHQVALFELSIIYTRLGVSFNAWILRKLDVQNPFTLWIIKNTDNISWYIIGKKRVGLLGHLT